ncbi:hypothetical protein L580_2522 [Serratia fonticola AU-P3(3)]|nr:hypothetical protein L580_2522 [Serratia fonticola AU-P3(3)]
MCNVVSGFIHRPGASGGEKVSVQSVSNGLPAWAAGMVAVIAEESGSD